MINNIFNTEFFITEFNEELKDGTFVYPTRVDRLQNITTQRCVILTLPGAFTPTCTLNHVPGFEAAYDELKSFGIKEIYVMTNNDFFTQRVWADAMRIQRLKFISDFELRFANHFNNALYRNLLGVRNRREILLFDDNKIEKRFSEVYQNHSDDPYENTKVENLLEYLKSQKQILD